MPDGRPKHSVKSVDVVYFTSSHSASKNRKNLLTKSAGSSWGVSAETVRQYEYLCLHCAPVWTRLANSQPNSTMQLISDTLWPTPLPWFQVLANIELPALGRKAAADRLIDKFLAHKFTTPCK